MADTNICYYDAGKENFVAGDPDSSENSIFSMFRWGAPKQPAASVFHELDPSTVNILVGDRWGSGIALNDQEQVATDAHVALFSNYIQVETSSGEKLDATVSKLDIIKDIAILDVPGLRHSGARPVQTNVDAAGSLGMEAYAVGFPENLANDVPSKCISGGKIEKVTSAYDILSPSMEDIGGLSMNLFTKFWAGINSNAAPFIYRHVGESKLAADRFMKRPMIYSDIVGRGGLSGGGVVGEDRRVIGLADYADLFVSHLVSTPIAEVLDLASKPSRFTFKYDHSHHPVLQQIVPVERTDSYEADLGNSILSR